MYLKAATLDDLLKLTFLALLKSKVRLTATKGPNTELSGVVLELTQPRARISRTDVKGHVFSCLGELFWYLAKSNNSAHIQYYIQLYKKFTEPDGTVRGAYGPRIFGGKRSQYDYIIRTLRKKTTSRQAVIQIFDSSDLRRKYKDTPCTCTLQFIVRDNALSMIVHMRSNDAYMGLPHDVFAFTMIQEILARELGCRIGTYKHMVGSLHLYDCDVEKVGEFLSEGVQSTKSMPDMPIGNQWDNISQVIQIEETLRLGRIDALSASAMARKLPAYWSDIARLFAIYKITKEYGIAKSTHSINNAMARDALRQVVSIRKEMTSQYYASYIRKRTISLQRSETQMSLIVQSPPPVAVEGTPVAPN
jgi:thymidylate synthase